MEWCKKMSQIWQHEKCTRANLSNFQTHFYHCETVTNITWLSYLGFFIFIGTAYVIIHLTNTCILSFSICNPFSFSNLLVNLHKEIPNGKSSWPNLVCNHWIVYFCSFVHFRFHTDNRNMSSGLFIYLVLLVFPSNAKGGQNYSGRKLGSNLQTSAGCFQTWPHAAWEKASLS